MWIILLGATIEMLCVFANYVMMKISCRELDWSAITQVSFLSLVDDKF
jgi:hypothetical protein